MQIQQNVVNMDLAFGFGHLEVTLRTRRDCDARGASEIEP